MRKVTDAIGAVHVHLPLVGVAFPGECPENAINLRKTMSLASGIAPAPPLRESDPDVIN